MELQNKSIGAKKECKSFAAIVEKEEI